MRIDLENLPSDTVLLHRLVRDMVATVESRDGEIERLQLIIKKLQRARSSDAGPSASNPTIRGHTNPP
jgi:transposase